jgi:hypothetical protein
MSLGEDQDDISTCTFAKAKAHCPIGVLQKIIQQKSVIRNIKGETLGGGGGPIRLKKTA